MAPVPTPPRVIGMGFVSPSAPPIHHRDILSQSFVATIVVLSITSITLLAGLIYLLARIWKHIRPVSKEQQEKYPKSAGECKEPEVTQQDLLRKNSNVLWSVYIDDDDLKSQFSKPKSRLLSIGSVSTIDNDRCPLDRRPSHAHFTSKRSKNGTEPPKLNLDFLKDDPILRNRPSYQQEKAATKPSRPRSMSSPQPQSPDCTAFEAKVRKQSLPVARVSEDSKTGGELVRWMRDLSDDRPGMR